MNVNGKPQRFLSTSAILRLSNQSTTQLNMESIMNSSFKILAALAAIAALAACETNPNASGDTSGAGGVGGTGEGAYGSSSVGEIAPGVSDRVFFDYDSSALDSQGQAVLGAQSAWLSQNANTNVTIEGHCDERGTREYNIALGERRAYAAKKFLVSQGVSPNRISTVSYGKERPAVVGSDEDSWAQNRRAVTVVTQ
jgi:peptidoglycan-associated lipoprotein